MRGFKKAFTLLELIFVIVVLGIVLGIIAEIISKMYGGYIEARTVSSMQSKTEIASQQIANRLSYRIRGSEAAIDAAGNRIRLVESDGTDAILEWIGRDYETFRGIGANDPQWSGFIDLDHPNTTLAQIRTPGTLPDTLMDNTTGTPAIFFRGRQDDNDISKYYATADNDWGSHYGYPVQCLAVGCDDTVPELEFVQTYSTAGSSEDIIFKEQYDLSSSAYALVPDGDELKLYYGYKPWEGEDYENDGAEVVLVDDLQTFQFRQIGQVISVKVCASESDGEDDLIVCKEKAIL